MTPLRLDDVSRLLPDFAELRPIRDRLLAGSMPDPTRRWAASSELDTAGSRLIDTGGWAAAAEELAAAESDHLAAIYRALLRAVDLIAAGDRRRGAEALLEVAALEERRHRPTRAEAYAASAAEVARSAGEPRLRAMALRRRARALRAMGRLVDAAELYEAGHELADGAGDIPGAAEGAIGVGNVLEEQGRWAEAKPWYRKALDLVEVFEEPGPERWHALLNLHVVARSLGQVDESVDWLRRADEVAGALNDPSAPAILHNAWGQLLMARGDFDGARRRFRDALDAPASAWARVNFRLNLGEALLAEGHALDAAEEVREAEREALGAGVASKLPEVYRVLGRIATARGNADAMVLFERSLRMVRERELPPIEEAVTLQAYAQALEPTDAERAEALRQRAVEIYRELGVPGMRETWAESFGMARDLPEDDTASSDGRLQGEANHEG